MPKPSIPVQNLSSKLSYSKEPCEHTIANNQKKIKGYWMITGLNHINLSVQNMDVSFNFYKNILGFTPLCKWEGSAYFLVGEPDHPNCLWFSLDYDRYKKRSPSNCNTHIAFSVSEKDFKSLAEKILASGSAVFKENTSPGESLYFLDPDGHKLEIHVGDWKMRIAAKKANPGNWKNVEWFI
jgi:catechol 2,3-dioxygenase-like lactoylglutathione lyase family enzyme